MTLTVTKLADANTIDVSKGVRKQIAALQPTLPQGMRLDVVTDLCDRLLSAGAPGLHFYTMNQAGLTSTIWQRLGI